MEHYHIYKDMNADELALCLEEKIMQLRADRHEHDAIARTKKMSTQRLDHEFDIEMKRIEGEDNFDY